MVTKPGAALFHGRYGPVTYVRENLPRMPRSLYEGTGWLRPSLNVKAGPRIARLRQSTAATPTQRVVVGTVRPARLRGIGHGATGVERIVVTHIRDDLCLVAQEDHTLSAHSTEQEALSAAFAVAARCIRQGHEAIVVLTPEEGPRRASLRRRSVDGHSRESGRARSSCS